MTSRPQATGTPGRRLRALAAAALAVALVPACAKHLAPQIPEAGGSGVAKAEAPQPQPPPVVPPKPAPPDQPKPVNPAAGRAMAVQAGRQVGPRISTYYLSPGDEIRAVGAASVLRCTLGYTYTDPVTGTAYGVTAGHCNEGHSSYVEDRTTGAIGHFMLTAANPNDPLDDDYGLIEPVVGGDYTQGRSHAPSAPERAATGRR